MLSINDIGCLGDFEDESDESLAFRFGHSRKLSHNGVLTSGMISVYNTSLP